MVRSSLEGKAVNVTLKGGRTLLVDGPASVTLISGQAEVFGFTLNSKDKIVVRDGKRMPFAVEETATFSVSLGENASLEEFEGKTIPPSWNKACDELLGLQAKPVTALVLGAADSGKTSFCTYIVNRLLKKVHRVAIIDGDLGQSDIGPPCTISYAIASKPITDLFNLRAENAYFVGVTSPSRAAEKAVYGLTRLFEEVLNFHPDFVVVNTDGWVEGDEALKYKIQIIAKIVPHIILCIQEEKLKPILSKLEEFKTFFIDPSPAIKQRSREKRRSLRELGYMKYLKNGRVQSLPVGWLKIEDEWFASIGKSFENPKLKSEICNLLGIKSIHLVESRDKIFIVLNKDKWISPEKIIRVEEVIGKKISVFWKGFEEGFLTALYDKEDRFLGLGILKEIDYERKVMKIYTPVEGGISTLAVGKVKVDRNFREISPALLEENNNALRFGLGLP